jgi:hypothetical protein
MRTGKAIRCCHTIFVSRRFMPSVVPLFHAMKPGRAVRLTRRISRGNRPHDARKAAEEALELARRYGERGNEAEARGNEAEALRVLGECAAAAAGPDLTTPRTSLQQALTLAEELEMHPLVAHCHLASASSTAARTNARRPRSTSLPRRRCTARWI